MATAERMRWRLKLRQLATRVALATAPPIFTVRLQREDNRPPIRRFADAAPRACS